MVSDPLWVPGPTLGPGSRVPLWVPGPTLSLGSRDPLRSRVPLYRDAIFGRIFPHFSENENFPEKFGSVTFLHLWTPNRKN